MTNDLFVLFVKDSVCLDAAFENMWDLKGTRKKASVTNEGIPVEVLMGCKTVVFSYFIIKFEENTHDI
jgi:hypothetical protein